MAESKAGASAMQNPNAPFTGSTALVIGAGANIGRSVVQEFARRGARVIAADLNAEGAQETADLVKEAGGEAYAIACDVGSDASVRNAADEAERLLGPIDIVMNNAGIISGGNPEDIPVAEWQRMMDINFFGMVRSNEVFLPRMIARGRGYIVNTASFAGLYPFATSRIHYAASKAAVVSMSENLALYLMDKGIRVSCLCPGPVMTTSVLGMRHFSENYTMRAPGSHLFVKSQDEAAIALANGMRDGRIIIPTHEELWETLDRRGPRLDDFIRGKHAEFSAGDSGRPQMPEYLMPKKQS
jgi:NAD(P)-dependent dehydrogenase (short-subunit alcohol dehydrogenase family)